jgi:hypothetical protein
MTGNARQCWCFSRFRYDSRPGFNGSSGHGSQLAGIGFRHLATHRLTLAEKAPRAIPCAHRLIHPEPPEIDHGPFHDKKIVPRLLLK